MILTTNPSRQHRWQAAGGFTLIELLMTVAVVALLAAIAGPIYSSYQSKLQISQAVTDIVTLSAEIERFRSNNVGQLPAALSQLAGSVPNDPWGNAYTYTRIEGVNVNPSMVRWDKNLKPINADYDLYSSGADGQSKQKVTHQDSLDDIIRANGGEYVGLASDY